MFLVDTNVFVYAANTALPEHDTCRRLLEKWQRQQTAWYTTWGILYEFLRVVSHGQALRHPWSTGRAVDFVQVLLASPGFGVLTPTPRHASLLAETVHEVSGLRGSILHDVHTVVLMREHGIRRIVTRDSQFRRFPFLEVVDPLGPDQPEFARERASARYGGRSRRKPRARA